MNYQCTWCGISAAGYDDPRFISCKENRHSIIKMLEPTETIVRTDILSFAHNPDILQIWNNDLNKTHVGDDKNKVLAGILLASSKRNGHEQAVIIQKQSSAGGSNLQNSILEYFDDKIKLTRMTGAYLDRSGVDYAGKILAIGEMSGFDSASSSLRQKLSEGKTELATTGKNDKGGIITEILQTQGRPSFITTTTSLEIHPELENRCWILSIDETQNQTKEVNRHQFAKDTFEYANWTPSPEIKGLFNSDVLEDHRVVNPFAKVLGEQFPCDNVTARRDSKRFADLTTTITYIHQHQRIKIVTRNQTFFLTSYRDLELALYYGENALKNTLNKLDKKAESVLEYMKASKDKKFFTRNDLCNALEIPYETMKRLLAKLVGRSFVELIEENHIWKYRLSNKVMIGELSFGGADFEKSALEYLGKHASNFEQIIMPPNCKKMTGIDKTITDYLLSFSELVTDQNGESMSMVPTPITMSPHVLVTDTNHSQDFTPITDEEANAGL